MALVESFFFQSALQIWRESCLSLIKMVVEEKLVEHFKLINCKVKNKEALQKCIKLCKLYDIDEESIAEKWVMYVMDAAGGNLELDITTEQLNDFEKWMKKSSEVPPERESTSAVRDDEEAEKNIEDVVVLSQEHNKKKDFSLLDSSSSMKHGLGDEDVLEMYGFKKTATTNIVQQTSLGDTSIDADRTLDTDIFNSTAIIEATNSGEVLLAFGDSLSNWNNSDTHIVQVRKASLAHVLPYEPMMFNKASCYGEIHSERAREMAQVLCSAWPDGDNYPVVTSNVKEKVLDDFRTWGYIHCDDEGKLNSASVVLKGDREHWYHSASQYEWNTQDDDDEDDAEDYSQVPNDDDAVEPMGVPDGEGIKRLKDCIPLDLSHLRKYSLFPGQFVGIQGRNPTRERLSAYKIVHGLSYPPPSPPTLAKSIQIVIGAGPFTLDDVNDYQPLFNLMNYVAENEPNVLILVGPFQPENSGHADEIKDMTYQEMFELLVKKIQTFVERKCTQVVLVSSYEDLHADCMFPTPEYILRGLEKRKNLLTAPDPCTLDVEGLKIGVTSTDIIRHLSSEEISSNMPRMDRLGRLAEHLLLQQSFYPLYPPAPDVPLDMETWAECGIMEDIPHILLLPSTMKYFCKWSNGTCILNPSRISKGTFARLSISPSTDKQWSQKNISGEILKL